MTTHPTSDLSGPRSMLCMQGQGVVKGYAIGKVAIMSAAALEVAHYRIAPEDVQAECERLKNALSTASVELQAMAGALPDDAPRELGPLLTVHSLLLEDPMLFQQTCELILTRHYNAEWALTTQGQLLAEQFAIMEDEYLRERSADIRQVIERVLRVLSGSTALLPEIEAGDSSDPLIVVARDISPADMLRLRGARFAGFLTDLRSEEHTSE